MLHAYQKDPLPPKKMDLPIPPNFAAFAMEPRPLIVIGWDKIVFYAEICAQVLT